MDTRTHTDATKCIISPATQSITNFDVIYTIQYNKIHIAL